MQEYHIKQFGMVKLGMKINKKLCKLENWARIAKSTK